MEIVTCVVIDPEQILDCASLAYIVLFTYKLVHERRAALALDIAAPVELAMAPLVLVGLELVVSSAATHQLAAVHAF